MADSLFHRLAQGTLDLVRIPSESGDEQAVARHVLEVLAQIAPAHVVRGDTRLAATFGCGPENMGEALLLAGHLDTVPEAGHPGARVDGGTVWGRGASDMKGALAVMLELARDWRVGMRPLALVMYDCEEVAYERNGLRPLLADNTWLGEASAALLMEPTDNEIQLGCMGTLHAKVTYRGRAAHSARPWQGENAIHKAGALLQRLAELEDREVVLGPVTFKETMNATMASGGISRNVIPDAFTVNVNFRFAPDRSGDRAVREVRELVGPGADVEIVDLAPSAAPRLDSPVLKRLTADFGLKMTAKQAWTDIHQLNEAGLPAANFGPGVGALAHQQNESVPVENLAESYRILKQLVEAP